MLASTSSPFRVHPDAASQSARLAARIAQLIEREGGWIGFDRFMQMALYEPELGYYAGGSEKFGRSGDFLTAPEMSSLFGRTLAHQLVEIVESNAGDILELGPGTGALAVDILRELEVLDALPSRYLLLDVSSTLRVRQRERIAQALPHLLDRVEWVSSLPEAFSGAVIANEVLDAIPVKLISWLGHERLERGVVCASGEFRFEDRSIRDEHVSEAASMISVPSPYLSELHLESPGLMRSLAERLQTGAVIFVDYGFGAREYYHPQRATGTLMCHYQHHAHDDPFFMPGLQDITSHVNFSAIAQAGIDEGLQLLGYTTQAHFLVNCGITELMAAQDPNLASQYLPLSAQAQKLLSPSEMGELFKVIALGRNIDSQLRGFAQGDLSRLL